MSQRISGEYRLTRSQVAYIAAGEYVRMFWWFLAPVPLFGLIAFLFGPSQLVRGIGLFGVLWPFTIPARAILATSKAGKLFDKGAYLTEDEENLYFHGGNGEGLKLSKSSVRDVQRRGEMLVLRLKSLGFVPIPTGALDDPESFIRQFGPKDA